MEITFASSLEVNIYMSDIWLQPCRVRLGLGYFRAQLTGTAAVPVSACL